MQISDPQNRSLVAFSHRILAVFVGLRRNDSEIGLFPLAVGGRSIRAFPFSSGVHRFLSTSNFPLCSILFFLSPLPAEILCRLQFPYAGLPEIRNFPFRVGLGFSSAFLCRHRTRKSILCFFACVIQLSIVFRFLSTEKGVFFK